ncbi:MAG: mechanosensitive ion channel [Novosphingobium sp.]|nr:mechanosensitive ion channel [Novosphingobium sp.]MCP5401669.1 mechanosensitive ion channel [Novosphingobium sp.]
MQIGNYAFDPVLAEAIAWKIVYAVVILVVTYFLAKAAKWAFAKLIDAVELLRKSTASGDSIGSSLGKIVSLLIWLFGLLAVLQVFDLGGVMTPVQTLLNNIMGFIPNLVGAGLIFFIGAMVAKIVRDIVVTALQTVDFDKWANKGGVDSVTGNPAISKTIGVIVYVLIIIPVAILALDALDLESVSAPASDMLRLILDSIPRIIGAAILLGLGYLISRFVANTLKELLPGLGADRALGDTGILPAGTTVSDLLARIAQVAIILFFAIAATRLLGFPELTAILDRILELGGRVVFGSVVVIVGFLIARVLVRLITGAGEANLAANIVKWATIVLFTFMGLEFMGVGDDIVRLAFGALVIGGAVAGALAFGLGGRDWASRQLQRWENKP